MYKVKTISPIKKFKKIALRTLLVLFLLFGLILLLFSLPSVQTRIAKSVTERINNTYGTSIQVERVGLKWNGDVLVKGTLIKDHKQDTMIYVRELATSLYSVQKVLDNNMELGDITLEGVNFYLTKYKGEASDNLTLFSRQFATNTPKSGKAFIMSSDNVAISEGRFMYINGDLENSLVLDYQDLSTNWEDFYLNSSSVDAHIESLSFDAIRGYQIRSLDGTFHYDPDLITLKDFSLTTDFSAIEGDIKLDTSDGALDDFNTLVEVEAAFAKAKISTNDIRPFYREIAPDIDLDISGNVTGHLNDFRVPNLKVAGLGNSVIEGDVYFDGVVSGDDFRISGTYNNLETNYFDLKRLLPDVLSSLPPEMSKLGQVSFRGANTVTLSTVVTDGNITTNLGDVSLDLVLKGLRDADNAGYEGNVKFDNFNLGKLLDDNRLGEATFDMDVEGKGFIQENINTKLSGSIKSIGYNNYVYKNITVFGNLKAPVFDGELLLNDPNAKAKLNGLIDISKEFNSYDLEAQIDYADLKMLNFINDSISILKGNVIIDMKGTNVEDVYGRISFADASYQNKNNTYSFKDFEITSKFDAKKIRTIDINSTEIISGEVRGVFKFNEVVPLFKNAIGSLYTNYQPEVLTEDQFMDFEFTIYNKIVAIFVPELDFEPETIIRGSVVANDSEFKLTFKSPKIDAFGYMAEAIEVRVDNKNPLFNTYVAADSINAGFYAVSDFNLINVTLKDTLFMRSEFTGGKRNDDSFDLSLYHTINAEGNSVLGFKKSKIIFKEKPWFINEQNDRKNSVVFDNNFKDIDINTLVLSHNDERIDLKGQLRDSTYKDIKANFKNVDLAKVTPDLDSLDLGGRINGKLDILQKNGAYFPNTSLAIKDFSVNGTNLGQLDLNVTGNATLSKYNIKSKLERDGLRSLTADGSIDASGKVPYIDMDVGLKELDLSPFNPMGKGVIDQIRGLASGDAKVIGDYRNPDINGNLTLENAGIAIPYLNVNYDFKGISNVKLNKQQFIFEAIQLEDVKYKTLGALNGSISHKSFSDWKLDLGISATRIAVLDTEEDLESLYYGTAFLEGEAFIKGPTDNLVIDVFGETARGTTFKIPIDDSEALGDNSYIKFLSPEEKEARINGVQVITEAVKGLSVNFDLDIDPDAEVEVVVDKANGSTLRGRGVGTLLIQLDTNGKFIMNGDFIATEGVFNFRYGGFITKDFVLQQDANIRWDGDPAKALLDVSAIYRTQANPGTLLQTSTVNRKIPVNVVINLDGELLKPDITFDIEFPGAGSTVVSELEFLLQDRNAKELNAISLVSQGAFLSSADINTASAAVNNLLETTSSILSGILFNDDDSIFDVGIDLVQADRDPTLDVQSAGRVGVTLSTQITNRVLINGKVGVPTGGVSESVIVGDVEIDFLLNEDGTLRAKVFNRQTDIQFIGETEGYTQGVGLSYAVDFNTFKELLRKIFKGKIKEAVEQAKGEKDVPNKIAPDGVQFNR
ncbi:translocation/assembly module TamB domain-containing protein [Dokdonia sp. Asnod1-B02]|uniref:translocation/assembly module TamB domain-containing protein n=1 Tax=Dokdonia sp. Asnod1-B02 TaxID=3160573 RepID=UPI0038668E4E